MQLPAPLKVMPSQAAVASWRLTQGYGLVNLEISSGGYRLALGTCDVRTILDLTKRIIWLPVSH
jgi:hypothetical protein